IMLIARDGGCTKPGCTVGAYGSQAHHVVADWNDGGNTNVDELGLACGPDNRAVSPDGWTTRMNERGEVEWIPPPTLDTGQTRINTYHRPERLLRPPEQEPP
ncbi:HNH endonuclease signature motif containing protein, partial [Mycolicibacterium poriferae]